MFDTHCHLNFKRFLGKEGEIIEMAKKAGVGNIIIPGTNRESSIKALELAKSYEGVYAAVGIHPHHAGEENDLKEIEELLQEKKTVAVGEVGIDRHEYKNTKYQKYVVDEEFINNQKELLIIQIKLAIKYNKSLILHCREAKNDILTLLNTHWDSRLEHKTVFHCCEPDADLLTFAKQHHIFIGVDGDVTYDKSKSDFIKNVPLELLVLETDSPYLLPEPLRSQKKYPNKPEHLNIIAEYISKSIGKTKEEVDIVTTNNAYRLFNLPKNKT